MTEQESKNLDKVGPLIGSIIIILIIVLGAFYLFTQIKERIETQKQNNQQEISEINQSDEIHTIEMELNSMEMQSLEKEMQSLEVEFKI